MARRQSIARDDDHLAAFGIVPELQRQFSPLAMLGLAFTILNTWTALSGSFSLALPSGGTIGVLWGFLVAGLCMLATAVSLAELLSAYPTAGGQYHWVAIIAPPKWKAPLSYVTGYVNTAGWIALISAGGLIGSQLIFGLVGLYHPDFVYTRWQQFLIYSAINVISFLVNAFGNHILHYFNTATVIWSITGFVVICVSALACAAPNYNSGQTVFALFLNETGWPDGVAFLLGLLQGGLSLTAFDSVAHMIEELPNAVVGGPKIMIIAVIMGVSTGFIFLMCMLFTGGAIDDIIASPLGPLVQIIHTATSSSAGTVVLVLFPLLCLVNATIGVQTTAVRMTWAFARDRGLPGSHIFAKVHPGLGLPLNALILTTVLVTAFGLILIASTSAFNALISAAVVALGVSYAIPIAVMVAQRRRCLPASRTFVLPEWLGWTVNIVALVYTSITTVLFLFPPVVPVTAENMNYCIVAFGIVLLVAVVQWLVDGRRNFKGPHVDSAGAAHGDVLVGSSAGELGGDVSVVPADVILEKGQSAKSA